MQGNPRSALRACATGPAAALLQQLVAECSEQTAISCDYWRQQCLDDAGCGQCLTAMGDLQSTSQIADGALSQDCATLMSDPDSRSRLIMRLYITSCPEATINSCTRQMWNCVTAEPECAQCLSSTPHPNSTTLCENIFNSVDAPDCKTCPVEVDIMNNIVLATSVVGALSTVACVCVILLIVAHGKDLKSLRDRILIGLMSSVSGPAQSVVVAMLTLVLLQNAVYSSANTLPFDQLRTDVENCGKLAMSFEGIRFGRAWWFWGKVRRPTWASVKVQCLLTPSLPFM